MIPITKTQQTCFTFIFLRLFFKDCCFDTIDIKCDITKNLLPRRSGNTLRFPRAAAEPPRAGCSPELQVISVKYRSSQLEAYSVEVSLVALRGLTGARRLKPCPRKAKYSAGAEFRHCIIIVTKGNFHYVAFSSINHE